VPRNFRFESQPELIKATPERLAERKVGLAILPIPNTPAAKRDVKLYRAWADQNEWIRAAINHRKFQVSSAPWDIVPIDSEAQYDLSTQLRMIDLLQHPNPATDGFRTLMEKNVEDILVLDAGCIETVRTYRGIPAQLWNVDGATMRVSQTWMGDEDEPRYFWYPNGRFGAALLDKDLMYMMQNPSTHRVLGLSPLETLRETIDAEMQASRYNKGQVMQAPPHGIIHLGEDATVENVDQFERYWRAEIAGIKTTAVIGGTKDPKFLSFGRSQRDMQFLQWQSYLIRKIAAVFGISPQDLGILFDVNRANAETQADLSEDRGLRPLISLIESYINREVIGNFQRQKAKQMFYQGTMTGQTMANAIALSYLDTRTESRLKLFKQLTEANVTNLAFRFKIPSGRNTAARAATHKLELGGIPWQTVNKVRDEELEDPVEGGDEIIVMTPLGPVRLSTITGATQPNTLEQAFIQNSIYERKIIIGSGKKSAEDSTSEAELG